ncbi:MAG: transcription termination factor Rho [Clostridia bacterium]|nr:transcription termination factor Rho [Clostridia bacterium]
MSTKFSVEQLKNLGVYNLRELARNLGVKSPTTKKVDELIEAIMSINPEDIQPAKRGAGRPPKSSKTTVANVDVVDTQDIPPKKPKTVDKEDGQKKQDILEALKDAEVREGVFEPHPDGGYGFLRTDKSGVQNQETDAYVSQSQIKKFSLRYGDVIRARVKVDKNNGGKSAPVISIDMINGEPAEQMANRVHFDDLTPIYPDERYRLEIPGVVNDLAVRCIDLVAPIGKGQRAMIVSPPKAGKTTILKQIAHSLSVNYPEVELYVLLIDERPEEVTDMQRFVTGEVVYSTFDETAEHHIECAERLLEKAKRRVEMGKDVVILLDSLTRLARAYNVEVASSGKILSGGVDPVALHHPKRFFGAARNTENGGTLTIIATALVDTGSRMDEVIYEEFKGTGNMEIHLDRTLSERRIYPAISLHRSSTRREEALLDTFEREGMWAVRRMLDNDTIDNTERLLYMIDKAPTNKDFLINLNNQLNNKR